MSFRTFVLSSILAASALAQYGDGGYGGGSSDSASTSASGWSSWGGGSPPSGSSPWGAAASCPAGCQPIATGAASPPAPSSGEVTVQVVSVSDANGSLKYFPNNIQAPVGSVVQFQYHPKNHTITESSFAAPCKPLAANLTSPTRPGLKSGFVPVSATDEFTPVFNVLINDTKPIWIYCGQTNHCQKGMAMVINQNNSSPNTIEAYLAAAAALPLTPTANSTTPPPAAPPANTYTFGGAAPAATAGSPPAPPAGSPPPPAGSPAAPAIATVSPSATTAGAAAPAVFTGAAVPGSRVSDMSMFGIALSALLALW